MFHETIFADRSVSPQAIHQAPKLEVAIQRHADHAGSSFEEAWARELAFRMLVDFKAHPHINNVLTHISGADWGKVEEALRLIVDPSAEGRELSPLARNILDLMCAERGVTGRIVKPRVQAFLYRSVEPRIAAMLIWRMTALFLALEWTAPPLGRRPPRQEAVEVSAAQEKL